VRYQLQVIGKQVPSNDLTLLKCAKWCLSYRKADILVLHDGTSLGWESEVAGSKEG
jgi:hypothetical protein